MERFVAVVDMIGHGQWDAATPCRGWSVRDLVRHVVEGNRVVAPVLAGHAVGDDGGVGALDGDELRAAARKAAAESAAAVAAEGALDGVKHPPHGDFPGEVYAYQRFTDNLIHSWDLARAVGSDERLAEDMVATCAAFFDQAEDLYRQAGFVAARAPVPPGADAQTVLLAQFGRRA